MILARSGGSSQLISPISFASIEIIAILIANLNAGEDTLDQVRLDCVREGYLMLFDMWVM